MRSWHPDSAGTISHRLEPEFFGIHGNPELGFKEFQASEWTASVLANAGYEITSGVAELATAFVATIGEGELVVIFARHSMRCPELVMFARTTSLPDRQWLRHWRWCPSLGALHFKAGNYRGGIRDTC
ncbi:MULTISPECIES: hypothetical protein [Arthrobacter]|uniref:Uncharacterized protein n=1 Tax=Arthrobacter psychrochitiniphilus TaxID=291045 RepID=A0A2V3DWI5_9MICC|nr:hypothetical protein [Arthrobacter psychrochitiniphilus]NYG16663.1 hypothetical protein [Arthrobacter psychrochitiniphilus]PXA69225.1 hypothetical protein CVS29_01255 [Arthrobacter psychrochitiniphilus]